MKRSVGIAHVWLVTAAVVVAASLLTGCTSAHAIPPLGNLIHGDVSSVHRLREDYVRLGEVATIGHDAIGMQCSQDGLAAVDAATAITEMKPSGYVLTDLEMLRLARPSEVAVLWQRAAESCAPLFAGRDSLIGLAATVPRRVLGWLQRGRT